MSFRYIATDTEFFNVLVGSEAIKYTFEDISAWRNHYAFEDDDYMQIGTGEGTQTNGGGKSQWALFSLFGKLDYNYADRYLFSATLRRDATSRLYNKKKLWCVPCFLWCMARFSGEVLSKEQYR